jgi:hypothetical protein
MVAGVRSVKTLRLPMVRVVKAHEVFFIVTHAPSLKLTRVQSVNTPRVAHSFIHAATHPVCAPARVLAVKLFYACRAHSYISRRQSRSYSLQGPSCHLRAAHSNVCYAAAAICLLLRVQYRACHTPACFTSDTAGASRRPAGPGSA